MPTNAQFRNDEDNSVFMARQLEQIEARVYEKKYPTLLARTLFPVSNEGGLGTKTITYRMIERLGIAQAISDYAKDFQRVNLRVREFTAKTQDYGEAIIYSQGEVEAAKQAAKNGSTINLDAEFALAARQGYEMLAETVADQGDADHGLQGFNTNPNIPIVAAPNGVSGHSDWPRKTADEIIADISTLFTTMATSTNDIHKGNALLISPERDEFIQRLRLSNTNVSLKEYIEKTNPGLQILRWYRMSKAGVGAVERMALYQRDPDVLQLREPAPFMIYPFQQDMLQWKAPCMGKLGGVVVRYPLACIFMDGI